MTTPEYRNELATLRALRRLDLIGREAVVEFADKWLLEIESSDVLGELAGVSPDEADRVDVLLDTLAAMAQLPPMTEATAGMLAAKQVALRLDRAECEPIDAAREIWRVALRAPAAEPRLRAFIGLASEWEDDRDNRALYDQDIREEARWLAEELS